MGSPSGKFAFLQRLVTVSKALSTAGTHRRTKDTTRSGSRPGLGTGGL